MKCIDVHPIERAPYKQRSYMSEKPLLLRRDDMLEPAQRIREMQEQSPDYHVHACESVVAMQEQIFDDSAYSAGADTLVQIMCEFWDDGEVFQPSVDDELYSFDSYRSFAKLRSRRR